MSNRICFESHRDGEVIRFSITREWVEPPRRFAWLWRLLRRVRDWGRGSFLLNRWFINRRGALEYRHGDAEGIVLDGQVLVRFDVLRINGPDFDQDPRVTLWRRLARNREEHKWLLEELAVDGGDPPEMAS